MKMLKMGGWQAEQLPMSDFVWFKDKKTFNEYCARLAGRQGIIEKFIETQEYFAGYCVFCEAIRKFKVNGGLMLGDRIHLREGMICEQCGSSNRHRLLFSAFLDVFGPKIDTSKKYYILERITNLFRNLQGKIPGLEGSEFFGGDHKPGQMVQHNGELVRNENFMSLSLKNNSLDCLLHAEVLEHVSDCDKALSEARRVLRPHGVMIFTVPFFNMLDKSLVRAFVNSKKEIVHIEQPEIHGNPLLQEGSLAFYHFGWDLLDKMRKAGFSKAMLGLNFDPFQGFLSTGVGRDHLQPILFRCQK
jgi:SAM-dependent methyltransferase